MCMRERERERESYRETNVAGEGPLYWPFLNPRCLSIFRALCIFFFDERFSTEGRCWFAAFPSSSHWPLFVTLRESQWLTVPQCVLCIYNFIMLNHSSGHQPTWSASGFQTNHLCFPVITLGTFFPKYLWLTARSNVSMQHVFVPAIQEYPAYLCHSWMICKMGSKWLCSDIWRTSPQTEECRTRPFFWSVLFLGFVEINTLNSSSHLAFFLPPGIFNAGANILYNRHGYNFDEF